MNCPFCSKPYENGLCTNPACWVDSNSKVPCSKLIQPELPRRPANALCIEIGEPLARCRMKTPKHWGDFDQGATRWLLSGGSPLVLGPCTPNACPLRRGEVRVEAGGEHPDVRTEELLRSRSEGLVEEDDHDLVEG
jgi:hypothetical protein